MSYSNLPNELMLELIDKMSDSDRIALYSSDPSLRVRRKLIMSLDNYYTFEEIEQINQDVNHAWSQAGYMSDSGPTSKFSFNLIVEPEADGTFLIPVGYNPTHVKDLLPAQIVFSNGYRPINIKTEFGNIWWNGTQAELESIKLFRWLKRLSLFITQPEAFLIDWSSMTHLTRVDLYSDLNNAPDSNLNFQSLPNLTHLRIDNVNISFDIPYPQLTSLQLDDVIPANLPTTLKILIITNPTQSRLDVRRLKNLQVLSFSIEEEIPTEIYQLHNLEILILKMHQNVPVLDNFVYDRITQMKKLQLLLIKSWPDNEDDPEFEFVSDPRLKSFEPYRAGEAMKIIEKVMQAEIMSIEHESLNIRTYQALGTFDYGKIADVLDRLDEAGLMEVVQQSPVLKQKIREIIYYGDRFDLIPLYFDIYGETPFTPLPPKWSSEFDDVINSDPELKFYQMIMLLLKIWDESGYNVPDMIEHVITLIITVYKENITPKLNDIFKYNRLLEFISKIKNPGIRLYLMEPLINPKLYSEFYNRAEEVIDVGSKYKPNLTQIRAIME